MEIDFVVASLMLAFGFLLLTLHILVKTQFMVGTVLNGMEPEQPAWHQPGLSVSYTLCAPYLKLSEYMCIGVHK
jgi:hypothetical protein